MFRNGINGKKQEFWMVMSMVIVQLISAPSNLIPARALFFSLDSDTIGFGFITDVHGDYLNCTIVDISATPTSRFEFVEWIGDIDGMELSQKSTPEISIIMNRNRTITARFGKIISPDLLMAYFGSTDINLEEDPDNDGLSTRMELEIGFTSS